MRLTPTMRSEVAHDLAVARKAQAEANFVGAWAALSRAHIVSQPEMVTHLTVHYHMLVLALVTRDLGEVGGQIARLVLAPLGHLFGRIPWGNHGRASISMLARAPLPADIAPLYAEAGIEVH